LIKDTLIGVINIADKGDGMTFDEDELQLLDFLSSQIALNYRRIQLYQKFKRIVKESKTLKNQLGQSSREANDLKNKVVVQEKLASIGKLAGGIAHEFNNPLDGVLRYTNLCLEHVNDDDVVKEYLVEIKHGLNRMVNIVKNLLVCFRSDKPSMQKIDPNQAVEQALSALQSSIHHKNIKVVKNFSRDLPLIMDIGLERVVSNLLRNAIDAVEQKGHIQILTSRLEGEIHIQIKDDGCGFNSEVADKIFEPFFTTKDMAKGCGLGLTIVDEIVKSYNGHVHVQSELNKGTIFTVQIPVESDD
jgi:two-component system NtrC family sensor kinase